MNRRIILPTIVLSQFACGSLWFASNSIMPSLKAAFNLGEGALGHLTSFVQFGFIIGTLIFALLTISDRFPPSRVFFSCALAGGVSNLLIIFGEHTLSTLLILRFLTGFCLAGIYPVGMKIAADYHEKGLGKALGFLIGALVLGTAFPHLLRNLTDELPWRYVLISTSSLSFFGGLSMLLFVPNGPYRKASPLIDPTAFFKVFKNRNFRYSAFGYFGHMWELYTFWAFIPVLLLNYNQLNSAGLNIPLLSFFTMGVGGIACVIGGYISQKKGSDKVAIFALAISGACCLFSPFLWDLNSLFLIIFLLIWGMSVVADSPQFSALVAHYTDSMTKGTALTIVNSIGFALTIISIQLLGDIIQSIDIQYSFLFLLPGPIFGLISMLKLDHNHQN